MSIDCQNKLPENMFIGYMDDRGKFIFCKDTNESAQLFESMRSIPVDDLLNVALDGAFNCKTS